MLDEFVNFLSEKSPKKQRKHIKTKETCSKRRRISFCSVCGIQVSRKDSLERHILRKHPFEVKEARKFKNVTFDPKVIARLIEES